ncbi:hypothetical protein EIZ83_02380 [Escherichia coli]|nr:hypothetical protein [Escherichia coli]
MAASVIYPLTGLGCFAVLPSISDQKLTPVSLSSPPVDRLCNELTLISTQPLTARQMLNIKHQQ